MKKFFASALLISIYSALWSQITITSADMPASGDTARYSTSSTRLNFDTTGAGITWDYSSLVATGQNIDSFRSALSINPLYVLSFGLNDYGTRSTNLAGIGALPLKNIYNFYKKTSSYLEINGYGAEYNSIPIPATYSTPDKVYQFPLTYGRMDTTPYELSISLPGLGALHQKGTRYNNVDGWGTIITPFDTFSCLRIRAYTSEMDSFTISALGQTFAFPRTTLTYQWLVNGQIIPVLEVTGNMQGNTFIPTSEKFRDNMRFIPPQFTLTTDFRASKTTCTMADTITITNRTRPNAPNSTYKYTITPSTYTFVGGTNDSMATPKVMFTALGLYTVSLHVVSPAGGSVPAIGDTTKVDYINVTMPSGIQELNAGTDIELYPIPVSDILTVQASAIISEVILINSNGQKVMTQSVNDKALTIDVKPYSKGIYLIDIETKEGHEVRKIVIQ